jgi:hypothetical protein
VFSFILPCIPLGPYIISYVVWISEKYWQTAISL